MKSQLTPEVKQVLHLESDEILVDTDGGSSGQTVIEHVGSSTYPGEHSFGLVCVVLQCFILIFPIR